MVALGVAAAAAPLDLRAQRAALPVIAVVNGGPADASAAFAAAFRKGLGEGGFSEGQNVTVEYYWLDGEFHRLPVLMADLVRRRVSVIATPVSIAATLAAKAVTETIPIVFGLSQDPVKFGLVASFPRPGGNITGNYFFGREVDGKRLELLHQLVPKAVHIALLLNPANALANRESTVQNLQQISRALGLQIHLIQASTSDEINTAFANLARDRLDALFVGPDTFFLGRRVQIAALAASGRIPAVYPDNQMVEAGGLMGYGPDLPDVFYQVGLYAGKVLNGAKPADLPVVQSTRFVFAINLKTAKLLGIDVPRRLRVFADQLIE